MLSADKAGAFSDGQYSPRPSKKVRTAVGSPIFPAGRTGRNSKASDRKAGRPNEKAIRALVCAPAAFIRTTRQDE
jgi:hypothetical protein